MGGCRNVINSAAAHQLLANRAELASGKGRGGGRKSDFSQHILPSFHPSSGEKFGARGEKRRAKS